VHQRLRAVALELLSGLRREQSTAGLEAVESRVSLDAVDIDRKDVTPARQQTWGVVFMSFQQRLQHHGRVVFV